MAVTPVYEIPYVESSDLVANYPGVSESLAEQVEDKLPTYAATAPASPSVGQVWIDSSGSPIGKVWDGSAWTIFSGAGAANFTDTATGTYTDGGINYKYLTLTGTGTVTFDRSGYADIFIISGGGGSSAGADGSGGRTQTNIVNIPTGTHTVTIGAGGTAGGGRGQVSSLGTIAVAYQTTGNGGNTTGAGSTPVSATAGFVTSITNTATTFGRANVYPSGGANTGEGANGTFASTGGSGIVIIRVVV
jgi:hypothetical protein